MNVAGRPADGVHSFQKSLNRLDARAVKTGAMIVPLPGLSFVFWLIHAIRLGIDCMSQATKVGFPAVASGKSPGGRIPGRSECACGKARTESLATAAQAEFEWRRLTTR